MVTERRKHHARDDCAESGGVYIKQLGTGPAIGIAQMEPATYVDIWENFLKYRPQLAEKVRQLELPNFLGKEASSANEMAGNNYLAVAMCRIKYFRDKEALPHFNDVEGMAKMWKRVYNTPLGKGTEKEFVANYNRLVK